MKLLAASILVFAPVEASASLPEKGTVIFLGDSVTWQNLYVRYLEAFLWRAVPERDLTVLNRGVRGNTAGEALARLDSDVVAYDPALVVVMLGINDSGFGPPSGLRLSRYLHDMEQLLVAVRTETHAQLLVVTPTAVEPADERLRATNEMLAIMSRELVTLASRLRVGVLDIHARFAARVARDRTLMVDALHPGPAGHALIAAWLLDALLPELHGTAVQLELNACESIDGSPFALSHNLRNAFVPAGLGERNSYVLEVGDAACNLELVVDGQSLGHFTAPEWQRGVDLNRLESAPWTREATRVDALLREKWQWQYASWDPKDLGALALAQVGGPAWHGTVAELRARAHRELQRIDSELSAARAGPPVVFPARMRPVL